jgi:hypothetical protein
MTRKRFLTIASFVALAVGALGVVLPGFFLESKGVAPNAAASMWLREVGVVLVAAGVTAFLVRGHGDSPTLQAILIGNLVVQVGLFPIELIAYANGTITRVSGIVPNTALHVVLASGFAYYLATMKGKPSTSRPIAAPSAGQ